MITGGFSVMGRNHAKNQDSFVCEQAADSCIVAVSDGLGSKILSEEGAQSFTLAARAVFIGREGIVDDEDDFKQLVAEVHSRWITSLEVQNFSVNDCCCTGLILILMQKKIFAARLGDGFIGIFADKKLACLFDPKENRFFNETNCLTEKFFVDDWQFLCLPYDSFGGGIVCTDGVSFGENKAEQFTVEFCNENIGRPCSAIVDDLKHLLTNWKSTDDRTLAFILPDEQR